MNSTTQHTIDIAFALGRRGLTAQAVEVHTPDGRTWRIDVVRAGRGRNADGSWGSRPGAPGGFRLFEMDPEFGTTPEEHDAVDGDTWSLGDLADYLDAVGRIKH